MTSDPRIDEYIAAAPGFAQPILAAIRAQLRAACPALDETIKWRMPFFTYKDRPLANMAGFKGHASFGFWKREGAGEAEGMGEFGKLRSLDDLPSAAVIAERVAAAVALIDAGAPARVRSAEPAPAEVPPALAEALAADAQARATFDAFPPSGRRDYCDWVAEAKRDDTRSRRIAQTIAWLREGKRRNWQYERC